MPSAATYASSTPIGFNNSGQIFGTALPVSKENRLSYLGDTDCVVWTGTTFVDLLPSLDVQQCAPYAIDSANPKTGSYTVVGKFNDVYHAPTPGVLYNSSAFSTTITSAGTFAVEKYADHFPAALFGVNSSGTAIGASYTPDDETSLFVTVPPAELTWLQPSCVSPGSGCVEPLEFLPAPSAVEPADSCPFGGCTIDDTGRVLGYDPGTDTFAVRTGGASGSTVELPIFNERGNIAYVVAMNDSGEIPYFNAATPNAIAVYDVTSGTSTPIPPVAGTSCKHYYPVSINNLGQVLGFASFCSKAGFYWTWDSVHGTQDLNAQIAANPYKISPLGINDKGQILASLTTSAGAVHWGTLNPTTTATHPKLLFRVAGISDPRAWARCGSAAQSRCASRVNSFGTAAPNDESVPLGSPIDLRPTYATASYGGRPRAGITSRLPLASAPSYMIHKIGAPSGADLYSYPIGFNNTGQIFGSDCVLWTGSSFQRLPFPSSTILGTTCNATAINDANAKTGLYEVVGWSTEEFADDPHAFAATAGPSAVKQTTTYFGYAPSYMAGVNAGGTWLAAAEYARDTLYDVVGPHYFTSVGGSSSLTILQTPGSAGAPPVHYLMPAYPLSCPFGGCAINANNEILGFDYLTEHDKRATEAVYTVGKPASLVHLPIQIPLYNSLSAGFSSVPIAFNNANQILYSDPVLGAAVYSIGTGIETVIPVAAPNCQRQLAVPISMNDNEEVLGSVACPAGTTTYFTWDPKVGTQFLASEIPSSPYAITPLGVNDNGQILIKLTSSSGVTSWGTLDPVTSSHAKSGVRYSNVSVK